jgi:hypothetical protein
VRVTDSASTSNHVNEQECNTHNTRTNTLNHSTLNSTCDSNATSTCCNPCPCDTDNDGIDGGNIDVEIDLGEMGDLNSRVLNEILESSWEVVASQQEQEKESGSANASGTSPSVSMSNDDKAGGSTSTTSNTATATTPFETTDADWEQLWNKELEMLHNMGFETFGDMLPLLQQFLVLPSQLKQPSEIDATGMHKLITSLMSLRQRQAEAIDAQSIAEAMSASTSTSDEKELA